MDENTLNEKWNMSKVIQNAISSAHTEPSPETRERLKAVEIIQNNIMEKLEEFQKDNRESHLSLLQAIKDLETKLDKNLDTKADRWVERAFTYILYTVGGIILTSLIYLVIIKQ